MSPEFNTLLFIYQRIYTSNCVYATIQHFKKIFHINKFTEKTLEIIL